MKRFFLVAAALLALGQTAGAQVPPNQAQQVLDTWYEHYLGRPIDQAGMDYWYPRIVSEPSQPVLGDMLQSEEYYNRNGSTPQGFVIGLYRDVLGRTDPQPGEVQTWLDRLAQNGNNRSLTAQQFMNGVNIMNPPAVAAAPPVQVAPAAPGVAVPYSYSWTSPYRYFVPSPRVSHWSPHYYTTPGPVLRRSYRQRHKDHDRGYWWR